MRNYTMLFGLAALGLLVGRRQSPASERPAGAMELEGNVEGPVKKEQRAVRLEPNQRPTKAPAGRSATS